MNKKRWLALLIAFALFIGAMGFQAVSMAAFGNFEALFEEGGEQEWREHVLEKGTDPGRIVMLDVNGVIQEGYDSSSMFDTTSYRHRLFLSMLERAGEDPTVEGIVIRVNSPGGAVVETDEIYQEIREVQTESQKPVYVSMGNMAASGGYYLAAPADKIFANKSTITGSLGVILQSMNVTELAEQFGVKMETIKSGPHKDIMSPTREMTEDERAILQSIIDESYDQFVKIIAAGRDLSEARVREIADGRIYSGLQAKELGLVDEIGNVDETISQLKEDYQLGDVDVVRYEVNYGLNALLTMSVERFAFGDSDLLGVKSLLTEMNSPTLLYLYTE